MTISVVISTYNGESFIVEQLDSIRMQSKQPDEVLILDDISSDNTFEIIEKYIEKYHLEKTWKLSQNRINKGWRRNFVEGMLQAEGDLVFPCDQDDIWECDKLEILTNIMEKNAGINVLTTNCKAFYDNGDVIVRPMPENEELIHLNPVPNYFNIKYPGCTYCVRRSYLRKVLKYWQNDYPHDLLLFRFATFDGTLYSINKSLIRWRRHSNSSYTKESMESKTLENKIVWIDFANRFTSSIEEYLKDESYESEESIRIIKRTKDWLLNRYTFLNSRRIIEGVKLLKYLDCYPRKRQYLGDWYLVFVKK